MYDYKQSLWLHTSKDFCVLKVTYLLLLYSLPIIKYLLFLVDVKLFFIGYLKADMIEIGSCYPLGCDLCLFDSLASISASVSESLFAEAEEWLFLERFEELFIDLCQSTMRGAVAAAPISLSS